MNKDLYFLQVMALCHQTCISLKHIFQGMKEGAMRTKINAALKSSEKALESLKEEVSTVRMDVLDASDKNNTVVKSFLRDNKHIYLEDIEEMSSGIGTYLAIASKNPQGAACISELSKQVFDGNIDVSTIEVILEQNANIYLVELKEEHISPLLEDYVSHVVFAQDIEQAISLCKITANDKSLPWEEANIYFLGRAKADEAKIIHSNFRQLG